MVGSGVYLMLGVGGQVLPHPLLDIHLAVT